MTEKKEVDDEHMWLDFKAYDANTNVMLVRGSAIVKKNATHERKLQACRKALRGSCKELESVADMVNIRLISRAIKRAEKPVLLK